MDKIDALKGRPRLIQSNQNLDAFIREEIVGKAKISISVADFMKTEMFNQGKFIPDDFKDKGYTPQISVKQSYDDFVKNQEDETGAKDNVQGEKEERKDNSKKIKGKMKEDDSKGSTKLKEAEPENDSRTNNPKSPISSTGKTHDESGAPIDDPLNPLPNEAGRAETPGVNDISSRDDLAHIAKITLKGQTLMPTIKTSFWSGLHMEQSSLLHSSVLYTKYDTIQAPTYRLFHENHADMVLKWIKDFSFMFGKVESEVEPLFQQNKMTKMAIAGFNLTDAIKKLEHPNTVRGSRILLKSLADERLDPSDPLKYNYRRRKVIISTLDEYELQKKADEITRRRLDDVDVLHKFQFLFKDMDHNVGPIRGVDRNLVKFYAPGELTTLGTWMSDPQNFTMRTVMWDLMLHMVRTEVPITIESSNSILNELLQALSSSTVRADRPTTYPGRLSSEEGRDFIEKWLAIKISARWAKIWTDIDLSDASLSQCLAVTMFKLLFRNDEMHPDIAMDIDNYIARWILPAMKSFDAGAYTFDLVQAEFHKVNYLQVNYDAGVLRNKTVAAAFWKYFLNWCNPGGDAAELVPSFAKYLLNPRSMLYRPVMGAKMAHRLDIPAKFNDLLEMSLILPTNPNIGGPHINTGNSWVKLVRFVAGKRRILFSDLVWYADRVVKLMSSNAIVYPDLDDETFLPTMDHIHVPKDGLYAAMIYATINPVVILEPPLSLVHAAWRIHDDVNMLNDVFHFYASKLNNNISNIYSRKDWLKKAFLHGTDSTGFIAMLNQKLIAEEDLLSINMPPRSTVTTDFKDRRDMIENFISNNYLGFGYVNEFRYAPNPKYASTTPFQRYLVSDNDVSDVWDYGTIQDLFTTEEITPAMRAARREGKDILFKVPINFSRNSVSRWVNKGTVLKLPSTGNILQFGVLPFDYSFDDFFLDDNLNENYLQEDTPFQLVEEDPPFYSLNAPSAFPKLVRHMEVDAKTLELKDFFEFISVER